MVCTAEGAALLLLRNTGQQGGGGTVYTERIRRPAEDWGTKELYVGALNILENTNN